MPPAGGSPRPSDNLEDGAARSWGERSRCPPAWPRYTLTRRETSTTTESTPVTASREARDCAAGPTGVIPPWTVVVSVTELY
jgi:hypothetical protein